MASDLGLHCLLKSVSPHTLGKNSMRNGLPILKYLCFIYSLSILILMFFGVFFFFFFFFVFLIKKFYGEDLRL